MTCGRIRKRLIAYIEGSLPEAERREVEAHLESCGACARELKAVSETAQILRAARPQSGEPPPGFASRVAASLGQPARPVPQPRWAPAWAGVVVVAGLVLLLALGNWHRLSAPTEPRNESATARIAAVEQPREQPRQPGSIARSEPALEGHRDVEAPREHPTLATHAPEASEPGSPAAPGVEEPTHVADASAGALYGMAGGGAGPRGPAGPAAEAVEVQPRDIAARPVSVGPYNSDDEGSRLEEAMALFGY
jgi:hypothetical protein